MERDDKGVLTSEGRFSRDIFTFMEIICTRPFKFTELANWLMDNSHDLRIEFIGSTLTKSYRLHTKRTFIQSRFERFINKGYAQEIEKVESQKNKNTNTGLFRFTGKGLIKLFELKSLGEDYQSNNKNNDLELRKTIIDYIQYTLVDSVRDNFYSILIRRLNEISSPFFSNLANSYMSTEPRNRLTSLLFFPFFPNSSEFLEVNYDDNKDMKSAILQYGDVIMKTLSNLDEETKSLLLLELKRELEDAYLLLYPSREFEKLRFQNSGNNTEICLQTKCNLCQSFSPAIVNSIDLIKSYFRQIKKTYSFSCPKCSSEIHTKTCRMVRPAKVS